MDDSLITLVDETQTNNDDEKFIINLNVDEDIRNKLSIGGLIMGLFMNIILIVNINYNNLLNVFLCLLTNIFLLSPIIFCYKLKFNKLMKENIILIILLCISILFEFIICVEIDKNKLTLILIVLIKNIILVYYILKTNNLLECNII